MGGEYHRRPTDFRDWIRADGSTPYLPEAGRYHLYVSYACPWASRVLMIRSLRKLEEVISVSIVDPVWGENGWKFGDDPSGIPDTVNGHENLIDLYRQADPEYNDEETVPVLWDKSTSTIVNNESREILRMLDVEFSGFGDKTACFFPKNLEKKIDATIDAIYEPINNGVYRAGFAKTQGAYAAAYRELFDALDHWEKVLGRSRYLCGDQMTEADICLFTTLIRFDSVYVGHFKCNQRRLVDYSNLWGFTRDIYQTSGVWQTVNFDHIKRHYYESHTHLNPSGIVPLGPEIHFDSPHGRHVGFDTPQSLKTNRQGLSQRSDLKPA